MRAILISIVFVLFLSGTAMAAYTHYFYFEMGCGDYISTSGSNRSQLNTGIAGFITGINYSKGRMTNAVSAKSLYLWVENYCKENPLDRFADALSELDYELEGRAGK